MTRVSWIDLSLCYAYILSYLHFAISHNLLADLLERICAYWCVCLCVCVWCIYLCVSHRDQTAGLILGDQTPHKYQLRAILICAAVYMFYLYIMLIITWFVVAF